MSDGVEEGRQMVALPRLLCCLITFACAEKSNRRKLSRGGEREGKEGQAVRLGWVCVDKEEWFIITMDKKRNGGWMDTSALTGSEC